MLCSEETLTCRLTDDDIVDRLKDGRISMHKLESIVQDFDRAVQLRRRYLSLSLSTSGSLCGKKATTNYKIFENIPWKELDYSKVTNKCCENVIGYVPIPVGLVGPLLVDGKSYHVPMATTEGALIASTQRGCKALFHSGGVTSIIYEDAMTRGPVIQFPTLYDLSSFLQWINDPTHFSSLENIFNTSSRFCRLKSIDARPCGLDVYLRVSASTGDAMGMNMISLATQNLLSSLCERFPLMSIVSLSGNYCTDKKGTALNFIQGRGKSVISSAVIPESVLKDILKITPEELESINYKKNIKGSLMACSVGGFNAQAANIVTAIFMATGQDVAQVTVSANCVTEIKVVSEEGRNQGIRIVCTMPSIEVGTVGGGTQLPAQAGCLEIMGVAGPNETQPGLNSRTLASIVCAAVMAGELSLLAALSEGTLVDSHLQLNRGKPPN